MTNAGNLFDAIPSSLDEEQFTDLLARGGVRIERIVSTGQASPEGFWYDQAEGEWVVVLRGEATIRFEDEGAGRDLSPGNWVWIAPHRRHRVERTSGAEPTVWLAVHVGPPGSEG